MERLADVGETSAEKILDGIRNIKLLRKIKRLEPGSVLTVRRNREDGEEEYLFMTVQKKYTNVVLLTYEGRSKAVCRISPSYTQLAWMLENGMDWLKG